MNQPPWLEQAWGELGEKERAGAGANPRILQFYRDVGHGAVSHDEVAWCAAFAGASLERAGIASTRSLMARSYLSWGEPLVAARLGAVAVLERGGDPALGHVGFLVGETGDSLILLGGNQRDAVTVAPFARSRLLGLRWPRAEAGAAQRATSGGEDFARALAHVLEMEGGWSEDPYDPGGPTNFGITLAEYASWTGAALDASSRDTLKAALKAIAPETVREIYLNRYWIGAGCGALPPALALMHFDAAVNHGLGAAVRTLQEAVGATVDGEIGPETRAAIARIPIDRALARYADIRRRRYRALPHFWRFGRGWLGRVDRTLAAASAIAAGAPAFPSTEKGEHDMTDETNGEAPAKWWGESMTIWGTLITALATVLPALGPVIGIEITAELVQQAGGQIVSLMQAIAGLAGTIMAIYGRTRASRPLERRLVKLKL